MNDRLVTAVGAIAALAIIYALFFGASTEVPVTRPLSNEAGRNGYLALSSWLESGDVPVVSWRERFDGLLAADTDLAPTGNVMLTTLPTQYALRESEQQQLIGWIRRGNTLLIMAALNDSPDWLAAIPAGGNDFLELIYALTGRTPRPLPILDEASGRRFLNNRADAGDAVVFGSTPHPLMADVDRLEGLSDTESSKWYLDATETLYSERPYLSLARDLAADSEAAWQIPLEAGQVLLFASGSLLANHLIAGSDARKFIGNLLAFHLGPGGAFIFDDMHQGLSSLYDPAAFFADSRLHRTIAFLLAAWLVYLLAASNRIAPVRPERSEPRQADLLDGIGGFMARRLDTRETGLMLFADWFREVREHRGLAADPAPPWQALAATPTLGRPLLARLRDDYERLAAGQRIDLVHLHNRIRQARKAIG